MSDTDNGLQPAPDLYPSQDPGDTTDNVNTENGKHSADTDLSPDEAEAREAQLEANETKAQQLEESDLSQPEVDLESAVGLAAPPLNSGYVEETKELLVEQTVEALDETAPHMREVEMSYVTHADPARQVDSSGVYLDDIIRRDAELIRARIEGREPDLENPGSTASDVVQPTHVVRQNAPSGVDVPVAFTQKISVGTPVPGQELDKSYLDEE